jgi:hypothetical protein
MKIGALENENLDKKIVEIRKTNLVCSSSVNGLTDDAKQRIITVQINFKH